MENNKWYFAGNEHAVLLLHGLTGSPYEMKYLAQRLNKVGYTVEIPCLAGHGTTVEDLKKTSWQDWYATAQSSLKRLQKECRIVSVAGLCMGAVLALQLAYDMAGRISAVALLSTTLAYDGWAIPWYRFLTPLAYYTPLRYVYAYPESEPYGIKNARLRHMVVNSSKEHTLTYDQVPAIAMYELHKLAKMVKKNIPKINTPTLIIHSLEDDIASPQNAIYVAKNIGAKTVRKLMLDDCYHMITIDNKKALVADETINFFNIHSGTNRDLLLCGR